MLVDFLWLKQTDSDPTVLQSVETVSEGADSTRVTVEAAGRATVELDCDYREGVSDVVYLCYINLVDKTNTANTNIMAVQVKFLLFKLK